MDRWQEDLLYKGELRDDLDLDKLIGAESANPDQDIAMDLLKDAEFMAEKLLTAAMAETQADLRNVLLLTLNDCILEQHKFADYVRGQGWSGGGNSENRLAQDLEAAKELAPFVKA